PRFRLDPQNADFEYVAGLRAVDVDRPGQRVRATTGIGFAQLNDLLHRRARLDLVVGMHHGLDRDRIAGLDGELGRLAWIEPTPWHRSGRRRQRMMLAGRHLWRPIMVAAGLLLRSPRTCRCRDHSNGE